MLKINIINSNCGNKGFQIEKIGKNGTDDILIIVVNFKFKNLFIDLKNKRLIDFNF